MSEVESNSAAAAAVLSDVEHLRDEARTARHAYWFPLMVFGRLVTASAPLYVSPTIITESGSYGIEGQPNLGWLQQSFVGAPSPGLTALYWLGAILGGTAITGLWYAWYRKVAGLATRVQASLWAWLGATIFLVVALPVLGRLFTTWPITVHGTVGLLVVAVGFWVLAYLERSGALTVTVIVYTAAAIFGAAGNPMNWVYRLLGAFGTANEDMPFWLDSAANVLLPGLVLLVGGIVAITSDLRNR